MRQLFSVFLFSFASLFFSQCKIGEISFSLEDVLMFFKVEERNKKNEIEIGAAKKPANIIQKVDQMIILKESRPENVLEQIDGIEIEAKEKPKNVNQQIDKIKLEAKEKPQNEIQIVYQTTVLKESKTENVVEEIDSIVISAIEKEPLQSEYIDELFIEEENKPENEIQIVDQMEILQDEKPENEVEKEKYSAIKKDGYNVYSRDFSHIKTPLRGSGQNNSCNRKNLTDGRINKSRMSSGLKLNSNTGQSFALKYFRKYFRIDDESNTQDMSSNVSEIKKHGGRSFNNMLFDNTRESLEEELLSKGVKRNLHNVYRKIDILQEKKNKSERCSAPLRDRGQIGNTQQKRGEALLEDWNCKKYNESEMIDNQEKIDNESNRLDISSFSSTGKNERIVGKQNEYIPGIRSGKRLTKVQENKLRQMSEIYGSYKKTHTGKSSYKCYTDTVGEITEGSLKKSYVKKSKQNVGGKITAIKPGKNINREDKKFITDMTCEIKDIFRGSYETEPHSNKNSFGFNIVNPVPLENGFVKPELKNTYKKKSVIKEVSGEDNNESTERPLENDYGTKLKQNAEGKNRKESGEKPIGKKDKNFLKRLFHWKKK